MRIEIHKKGLRQVVIITFHTRSERFSSDYERNKFFRGLHGWKQIIPGENKQYTYKRTGLLDEIPHAKIADSVFMVAMENMRQVIKYFEQWHNKIDYEMTEVMMEREKLKRLFRQPINE
ncbi:MAG: hypothetical protein NT129_05260 [Candidatus Aenigmarchaeota archaeon]|nr:hypothetical protein [Candidatus Aenigmarchaeota archaeon]